MVNRIGSGLALLAALIVAGQASAGGYRAQKVARADVYAGPIKHCTRLNGRSGYYGNPWCNAREQAQWDRWDAKRLVR